MGFVIPETVDIGEIAHSISSLSWLAVLTNTAGFSWLGSFTTLNAFGSTACRIERKPLWVEHAKKLTRSEKLMV